MLSPVSTTEQRRAAERGREHADWRAGRDGGRGSWEWERSRRPADDHWTERDRHRDSAWAERERAVRDRDRGRDSFEAAERRGDSQRRGWDREPDFKELMFHLLHRRFGCTPLIERLESTFVTDSGKRLFGFRDFVVRDPVDVRKVLLSFDVAVPCTFESRRAAENALFQQAYERYRSASPSPPARHHDEPAPRHQPLPYAPSAGYHPQPHHPYSHQLPPPQRSVVPVKPAKVQPLDVTPPVRLYITNLHADITQHDLNCLLAPFSPRQATLGPVVVAAEQPSAAAHRRADAVFDSVDVAQQAFQLLDGLPVAGRRLRVGVLLPLTDPLFEQLASTDDDRRQAVDSTDPLRRPRLNDLGDERGGTRLTNEARKTLMDKLRASHADSSSSSSSSSSSEAVVNKYPPAAGLPGVVSTLTASIPSRIVLLKNLFAPPLTDATLIEEIREDVQLECQRFGTVERVALDPRSRGCVLVRFETLIGAQQAIGALDKAPFDGREISAVFFPDSLEPAFHRGALSVPSSSSSSPSSSSSSSSSSS